MIRLLLLLLATSLVFFVGCGDDVHNNFPSPLPEDPSDNPNPKKCDPLLGGDPCLPGCEPHDFICPPDEPCDSHLDDCEDD